MKMKQNKSKKPLYYELNKLYFGEFDLLSLIARYLGDQATNITTPLYLYSLPAIKNNIENFRNELLKHQMTNHLICYALKANPSKAILKKINDLGCGADIVSGGELTTAINAGIAPQKIVFSGVGKSQQEIDLALGLKSPGLLSFNVESIEELQMILQRTKELNHSAQFVWRFNPQVKAKTHKNISTGHKTHKFGLIEDDILKGNQLLANYKKQHPNAPQVQCLGLSMHIGSQLTDFAATEKAVTAMAKLAKSFDSIFGHPIKLMDFGGGIGIPYHHQKMGLIPFKSYVAAILAGLKKGLGGPSNFKKTFAETQWVFEPGRSIVGNAGLLITKVIRLKNTAGHNFVIVDGGMNDFARPALYDAHHEVYPLLKKAGKLRNCHIVGPVCETSDYFAKSRLLTKINAGDFLAIADTGAYGISMASFYNQRPMPAQLFFDTDQTPIHAPILVDQTGNILPPFLG